MYGIEYEDDILLLLRMIKFLHMQSPDAAHIFCQSHPVVDMEELLMVIDEVMWDIFDDVNFFFDEEYEATVVQCSHPIIDRLYEQGRASDPKHGSRQSVWSKKLHDITEYFVLGNKLRLQILTAYRRRSCHSGILPVAGLLRAALFCKFAGGSASLLPMQHPANRGKTC